MFRRAWTRYCQLLVEKPLPTKAATGGTLFALGDLIGQKIDGTLDRFVVLFDYRYTFNTFPQPALSCGWYDGYCMCHSPNLPV